MKWVRGQHRGIRFWYQSNIEGRLSPEQMLERPMGKGNSVAWLIWHCARSEDAIVNGLLRGGPQLLSEGWADKIGLEEPMIGTGFGDEELTSFTSAIVVPELVNYWGAVADSTSEWLKGLDPDRFDEVPDFEARLLALPPLMKQSSIGALEVWRDRSMGFVFSGAVILHQYMHVGEMQLTQGLIGVEGYF